MKNVFVHLLPLTHIQYILKNVYLYTYIFRTQGSSCVGQLARRDGAPP